MTGSELSQAKDSRALRLRTIEAVCDLMGGSPFDRPGDAIIPHTNGYSTWFISLGQYQGLTNTVPLSADEILLRIEAREALADAEGSASPAAVPEEET